MSKVKELHGAVKHGDTTLMKTLLDEDRARAHSVSASDGRGTYPLHGAAAFGQADAARMLFDYGADVSARDAENDACPWLGRVLRLSRGRHGSSGRQF